MTHKRTEYRRKFWGVN